GFGLFLRRPPDVVDAGEVMRWPVALECGARGADVAGIGKTLPYDWVDGDRQPECRGDGAGGFQGAGVGGHDDALDSLAQELLGGVPRLSVTEFGQARVDDAWIDAGGTEMQVEFALAMAQQDHAVGHNRGADWAASPV